MIYIDNAATSYPKPLAVKEALLQALDEFGNPSRGAHGYALAAGRAVEATRAKAAAFFGCPDPRRTVFAKNITEALNVALASIDGHIITTEAEHNSILRPVMAKNYSLVKIDQHGLYTAADVAAAFRTDTKAVALAHGSNVTGNVIDLGPIAELCAERGAVLIVDAAQTAGLLPINMDTLGLDALCFTGHKSLYGPQGTGGMCLGPNFTPRPMITGGTGSRSFDTAQPAELPDRLEAGTQNAPGLAALGAGLDYVAAHGPEKLLEMANAAARRFYELLAPEKDLTFYGDYQAHRRLPVITLNIGNLDSNEAADELWHEHGIAVRGGLHCAPLLHRRLGTEKRGAVRFSFSHHNTITEAEKAAEAVLRVARL